MYNINSTPTEEAKRKKEDRYLERLTRKIEVEVGQMTKQGMKKVKGGIK